MKKSSVLFLIATMLFIANLLHAQTAMFGVTPQHSNVYSSSFPSELKLEKKWKFKTNGMIFSSAVVVNDVIYFGSDDSCLYALDASGTQKWKFKSNGTIRSTPAVNDSIVFFNNYGGMFYAVSCKTGLEKWSCKTDGESPRTGKGLNWGTPKDLVMTDNWDFYLSSPVIVDTMVYFGSGKNVYAVNLKKNEIVWKYTASDIVHSSPAVSDGMIYFGCWDSKLYALNVHTGSPVWSYQTGLDMGNHGAEGIQSSPSIIDSLVIIGSRDANVYAIHAKTGKRIWVQGFGGSWMPSSFAVYNNNAYTGSSDAYGMFTLNLKNGKYTKTNTTLFTFSTPVIANETAFVGVMNGSLLAIDINTGKVKCKFDTDGRLKNPLKIIKPDGTLNDDVIKDLSSSSEHSSNVEFTRRLFTAGGILSTPAIDKNVVYFGSTDSCFYAIQDAGGCKPNFKVSSNKIELTEPVGSIIDTVIYIRNSSECTDSVKIYPSNFPSGLTNSFDIQPSNFNTLPNDSVGVHVKVNTTPLNPGKSYKFKLISQSKTNEYYVFNTEISFITKTATSVSLIEGQRTDRFCPNPFTNYTELKYNLEENCLVDIRIYNLSGVLMHVLVNQKQEIGEHTISWNGINSLGTKLNPGIYFCTILKGNSLTSKKITIV
jgi:eukaryotic-like serine/threonine-protein kinase